jgi:lipoprotein signal peptidase
MERLGPTDIVTKLLVVASKIDQYQLSLWRICLNRRSRNTGVWFSLLSKAKRIT